jgi:hypothetical protein
MGEGRRTGGQEAGLCVYDQLEGSRLGQGQARVSERCVRDSLPR